MRVEQAHQPRSDGFPTDESRTVDSGAVCETFSLGTTFSVYRIVEKESVSGGFTCAVKVGRWSERDIVVGRSLPG